MQPSLYVQVAGTHLDIQGEISSELLHLGREILETADKALEENPPTENPGFVNRSLDGLEVWLYTARCWMDFKPGMKEIQSLDEELQFAVTTKLAGWITEKQFH